MNSYLLQNIVSLEASLSKKENNGIKKEIATQPGYLIHIIKEFHHPFHASQHHHDLCFEVMMRRIGE